MSVESILKSLRIKNSLNKEDLQAIMQLPEQDQQVVIHKISTTRQKKLLAFLDELPYLEESF
jgi:hypothetical protein